MKRALAAFLLLSSCDLGTPLTSYATPIPLPSLPLRGAIQGSDQIPIWPQGGAQLLGGYASDLATFVSGYPAGIKCDGVSDDTSAIQAAITAGASFNLPAGVCKVSATLTFTSAANHGQVIRGAGESSGTGAGAKTVIRPTSAVSTAVSIDGSAFGGYVQGLSIENLVLDMANMSAGTKGFSHGQAYDLSYRNVRVINDGAKTSWNFGPGNYTTVLTNVQGNLVSCLGDGANNPTTISLINPDLGGFSLNSCTNVSVNGGAVQTPWTGSNPIIYLAPGTTPYAYVPNTGGLYAAVLSEIQNSQGFTTSGTDWEQGGGFPSTYNDGTHGTLPLIRVTKLDATAINSTFINPSFAGEYLLDTGINTRLIGQPESGTTGLDIHNGPNAELGTAAFLGTAEGVTDLANWLDFGNHVTWTITPPGVATFMQGIFRPTSDADGVLQVKKASGTVMVDCATNVVQCAIENSTTLAGYSDAFTTQAWNLTIPSAGNGELLLNGSGSATITLNGTNGSGVFNGPLTGSSLTTAGALSAGSAAISGSLTVGGSAVTALPSQGGNSGKYLTTNGSSPSWGSVPNPITAAANVSCTGTGCTINGTALNISSVTRLGTGSYQVNFTASYADTNYVPVASAAGTYVGVSSLNTGNVLIGRGSGTDGNFYIIVYGT